MTERRMVQPIPKGDDRVKHSCPCGCGVEGSLRRKVMKDGKVHARGCSCRRCIGSRNRTGGLQKQRVARRAIGVPDAAFARMLSDEERWNHPQFRCEVKSGQLARSVDTQYRKAAKQADSNKAIGDARPLLLALMPKDSATGYVILQLPTWQRVIVPLLAELTE